jgi:hypothetical protein
MNLEPLGPAHVRFLGGIDLLGWDELQALVFLLVGVGGGVLGVWLASQLRAVLA